MNDAVSRIKEDLSESRVDMRTVKGRLSELEQRLARMEGGLEERRRRPDAMPTVSRFTLGLIATVIAIAALVLTLGP
jgi:hypothetical protein